MDRTQFLKLMTSLRACYPQRVSDAEHWKLMVARYWDELAQLEAGLLAAAFAAAPREFPEFFPSLGQLLEFCSATAKRRQSSGATKRLPEVSSASGPLPPEIQQLVDDAKRGMGIQ